MGRSWVSAMMSKVPITKSGGRPDCFLVNIRKSDIMKLCEIRVIAALIFLFGGTTSFVAAQDTEPFPERWWKGNLHTHSLWSDGDQFPEMIADWYSQHGYNFLALSDHNVLSSGMRWMRYSDIVNRSDAGILDRYKDRFGGHWVETKGEPDSKDFAIRLKPLDEFRCLVEQANQFILIQAEEVSDSAEGKPVHINVANLQELFEPAKGATVREAMANNLRAIVAKEKESGRELLPHLNHPNFGYAVTAEDLAHVVQERFFEVHNGHPGVNQLGDKQHISIDRMWDVANAIRLTQLNAEPLFGVGTDDTHEYHNLPGARPGRGWVMVRSRFLTPEYLIRAMKQGDFYASSGVELADVKYDATARNLTVQIHPVEGATYRTEFVATLKPSEDAKNGFPQEEQIGVVVGQVEGLHAQYPMTGNELYVRARITSSLDAADPSWAGQKQQAWTQPVGWVIESKTTEGE